MVIFPSGPERLDDAELVGVLRLAREEDRDGRCRRRGRERRDRARLHRRARARQEKERW
jgi:hypothetical protein